MFNRMKAIRKRGFNLIEAAIVLGVVGAVLGGIWTAASSLYESRKVNKYTEDIVSINHCVQNKFPRLQCDSILCVNGSWESRWKQTKFFDDIGCIPANIERRPSGANTSYYDEWGRLFFVTLENYSSSPSLGIVIGQTNLNSISECAKLANRIASTAKSGELKYIMVGIHTHPNYYSEPLQNWVNACENDGTSVAVLFKP